MFRNEYAIAQFVNEEIDSPTIIGAQAANELLDINGIKASFVLTVYHDKIYISARSIDKINVQLIMEKLGGGGHSTMAAAQIKAGDIDEVKNILVDSINEYLNNK